MRTIYFFVPALLCSATANASEYDVEVKPFTKIFIMGNLQVNVHPGEIEKVHVTNNDSTITDEEISISVDKSQLSISIKGENLKQHTITIDIYCKQILGIDVRRGAFVRLSSVVNTDSLGLEVASGGDIHGSVSCRTLYGAISKGGTIKIEGSASKAEYNVFAGGDLHALNVVSEDIVAKIRTGGEVTVTGKGTLDVLIFSGGKLSYKGNPKLTQEVKIAGDIIKLDK